MKVWILRILVWCAFNLRIYYAWSRLYRWLWQRRYCGTVLLWYASFAELEHDLGLIQWKADGWKELWDAISTPQATWARHLSGEGSNDCDDISIYAADRIADMVRRGVQFKKPPIPTTIGLLSVPWVDLDGKAGGHNVCVFRFGPDLTWAYVSNWFGGKVIWGCEIEGRPFMEIEDVVRHVLGARTSLGWSLATVDLRLVRYGRGPR